jgi:hypothetical protein
MSMMARFVAVTPERLRAMQKLPDLVGQLLEPENGALPSAFSSAFEERVRNQAPQMLGSTLEKMPPEIREQLMRRLGLEEGSLSTPAVGEAILKRMTQAASLLRKPSRQSDESRGKSISLDKAWHGLHFLLCGAAEPGPGALGQAVLGGIEIGDDLGYGPARYFTAAEVQEIARALDDPGLEQVLHARFNPALMEQYGLYPGGWDQQGDEWLIDAFRELRGFYAAASEAGHAVIAVLE